MSYRGFSHLPLERPPLPRPDPPGCGARHPDFSDVSCDRPIQNGTHPGAHHDSRSGRMWR